MSITLTSDFFSRPRYADIWDLIEYPDSLISSPFGLSPMQRTIFNANSLVENLSRKMNRIEKKYMKDLARIKSSNERFEVNLDCSQFKPDEINVKMVDNYLVVDAKHEERADEHGYVSRQFTRRYAIPENVIVDKLESSLGPDGVLSIKAPKKIPQSIDESNERSIPITLTNEVYNPTKQISDGQNVEMKDVSDQNK